jgi:hypothetical protein
LGWSSSTTRCHAAARSASLSTASPALFVHMVRWVRRAPHRGGARHFPQVCPHLVNPALALWKHPAETLTATWSRPDNRRSAARYGARRSILQTTGPPGRSERGETRRASNITLGRGQEQYAIHRLSGGVAPVPEAARGGAGVAGSCRLSRAGERFDGAKSASVPFVGHPVSTGAACPRRRPQVVSGAVRSSPVSSWPDKRAWTGGAGANPKLLVPVLPDFTGRTSGRRPA